MRCQKNCQQTGLLETLFNTCKTRLELRVLLLACFGLASQVQGAPVTYSMLTGSPDISGSIGGVQFSNVSLVLTFKGDTTNVISFSSPVTGHELLSGTATVRIVDNTTGSIIKETTFLPAAGIFVSVDNTNNGIGFGSFGVPPSDPTFAGQPVYPVSMLTSNTPPPGAVGNYDLKSNINVPGYAISCVNFAVSPTCGSPIPLPTTAGDLLINHFGITQAQFGATITPVTPFSSLDARLQIADHHATTKFELLGKLTLGAASNGIDPTTDVVTLNIGPYTATIPPGSFRSDPDHSSSYGFKGTVGGVVLEVRLVSLSGNMYAFSFEGSGAQLAGVTNPVTVDLTIGNNSGTSSVKADIDRESDDHHGERLAPW